MSSTDDSTTDAQAIIRAMEQYHLPMPFDIGERDGTAQFVTMPDGMIVHDLRPMLDMLRKHPRRRTGTMQVHTLADLCAVTVRFAAPGATTCYVNIDRAGAGDVTTHFNHDAPEAQGEPGHGDFRAVHTVQPSPAWLAWTGAAGKWMNQADFAQFIDSRMMDLTDAPLDNAALQSIADRLFTRFSTAAAVMTASRGLSLKLDQDVTSIVNTDSGEVSLAFAEKHTKQAGAVDVPRLFAVAMPVWVSTRKYVVPIRLRYRASAQGVVWAVEPLGVEEALESATLDVVGTIVEATKGSGVTVVRGKRA